MAKERKAICVTSSKPSTVLTAGGGGGCLTLVCPQTTSVFSSLRVAGDMSGKVGVGLTSLSFFPKNSLSPSASNGTCSSSFAMGYGYTTKNKEDSYAMLLTIRQASLPPILHWKTRLPEGNLTAGIAVSPCGHYAIGGGSSGNLYVWSTLGGNLLRVVKAHYRPVQQLTWTTHGRHLATGGADGMVHVFDLADLVESSVDDAQNASSSASASASPVSAIRTWSQHHLPITGLVELSDHRLASASSDGKILLLHVPSQKVMATIQMPRKVSTLLADGASNTLYVGCVNGNISVIRLDEYAMHQLSQQHGMAVHRGESNGNSLTGSVVDQVFSTTNQGESSGATAKEIQYQTELKGHDRPISALTIIQEDDSDNGKKSLCSGDEIGCLRIWDLESGSCLHVTRPWSTTIHSSSEKTPAHPITSLTVLSQSDDTSSQGAGMLDNVVNTPSNVATKNKQQQQSSQLVSLLAPLQKFRDTEANDKILLPVWNQRSSVGHEANDNVEASHEMLFRRYWQRKRQDKRKYDDPVGEGEPNNDRKSAATKQVRINELERGLAEAKNKIERWEAVNNKLMSQLKK